MSRLAGAATLLLLPLLLLLLPLATADDDDDGPHGRDYFPWEMNICSVKDKRLNECFRDAANLMIQYLVPGMKKVGALPLDPLKIPYLGLERDNTVMPSLAFNVTNSIHRGWKNAKVINATVNPCGNEFRMRIFFPRYKYTGDYEVQGRILDIPLMGKGEFAITFLNLSYHVRIRGHIERRRSSKYLRIDHFAQRSVIGDAHFEVRNLFGHDLLSNVTNSLLNWNSKAISRSAEPVMDRVFGEMHRDIVQRIFDKVPYDNFFDDLRRCGPSREELPSHYTTSPPPHHYLVAAPSHHNSPPSALTPAPSKPADDDDDDDDDDLEDSVLYEDDDDEEEEDDYDDEEETSSSTTPAPIFKRRPLVRTTTEPPQPETEPEEEMQTRTPTQAPARQPVRYQTVLQAILGKFG